MILRSIRHIINNHQKTSAFLAGVLCMTAHAPIFFIPGLLGLSILVHQIYTANNIREVILRNMAFGYGYFGCGLSWICIGISVYINDFWWMIPICLLGMPLIFCLFTTFSAITAWYFRSSTYFVLIFATSWVSIEWVTSWIFTGLPWMLLGYSVGFSDVISQIACICGVFGISFIIFYIFGTYYYIWNEGAFLLKKDVYCTIGFLVIISLFGLIRLENNPTVYWGTTIRMIQPSITQVDKWEEELFWKNLNFHKHLSLAETGVKADIILWSEAAVVAPIQSHVIMKYLSNIAKDTGSILITGAISKIGDQTYTSANGISPNGELLFDYHKHHLVPFGEYVPLKTLLPIKKLTAGFEDYAAGSSEKIFNIKIGKDILKIRPLICYESIFASEVNARDADVIINFTNNAWYGNSMGPYQHFNIGKFRAIENGIPLIVVANNGISGVIDAVGRVLSKTKLNDKVVLDSLIPKPLYNHK